MILLSCELLYTKLDSRGVRSENLDSDVIAAEIILCLVEGFPLIFFGSHAGDESFKG